MEKIKGKFIAAKDKTQAFFEKHKVYCLAVCGLLAFILNLVIESCARHSLTAALGFFVTSPLVFIYNVGLIFIMLAPAIIFRRRIIYMFFVTVFWLVIGIVNGVILANRMTPFTVKDLANLSDGMTIITNYLSVGQIILAGIAIVFAIILVVFLFIKAPKKKEFNRKKNILVVLAIFVLFGGTSIGFTKTGLLDTFFGNLAYAYRDNGVPYCFINTWLNTGVSRPMNYGEEEIETIFTEEELELIRAYAGIESTEEIEISSTAASKVARTQKNAANKGYMPNIIFLQLESFIDPALINSIELTEEATPYWNELQEKYSTGYLTVPSVGAGTANTEFETICGMSVKFFGPGEYPYKSILSEETCESYPYNFKNIGYSTHAIHNHRGVFYLRNEVFANLGFDTFTSLEYMSNVIKTPKNWAKDHVLIGEIIEALNSTDTLDYIYTISVQGHGKYPSKETLDNPLIQVTSAPTEELKWQYEYYVNQLYEMDQFVKDLIRELEKRNEKTVLVMYGDHLPALDMTEEELVSGDLYKTEYIIYSTFDMQKKDQDLYTYQLAAEVLDQLGLSIGTMSYYHQNYRDSETYLQDLKALEYDMLYGHKYLYGSQNPFEPTELQMGIREIKVNEVVEIGGKLYIKGENFTEQSRITLDGKVLETIFLGPTVLGLLEDVDPDDAPDMKVSQVDRNSGTDILSTTE